MSIYRNALVSKRESYASVVTKLRIRHQQFMGRVLTHLFL